jgi:hypothetical protein
MRVVSSKFSGTARNHFIFVWLVGESGVYNLPAYEQVGAMTPATNIQPLKEIVL